MAKPCTPHPITRKGYATSVRQQSCQRLCNAQRVQLFEIETANVNAFLLDGRRPFSFSGKKMGVAFVQRFALLPRGINAATPFAPVRKSGRHSLT